MIVNKEELDILTNYYDDLLFVLENSDADLDYLV